MRYRRDPGRYKEICTYLSGDMQGRCREIRVVYRGDAGRYRWINLSEDALDRHQKTGCIDIIVLCRRRRRSLTYSDIKGRYIELKIV